MPSMKEFCTIEADLGMNIIGKTPSGMRIDFPFKGTATSEHWDGERPVSGVDYVTVRSDGNMELEVHATIGEKREAVSSRPLVCPSPTLISRADPKELIVFRTGNEDLAWLNNEVGVAFGRGEGGKITLAIYILSP